MYPSSEDSKADNLKHRLELFEKSLHKAYKIPNLESIAFAE